MTAQLLQRQLVHVQLLGMRVLNDEILLGVLREIRYLVQLVHADVAAQALSVAHNLLGIIAADTRHLPQFRRISHVQHDVLGAVNLPGVRLPSPISPISPIAPIPHQCRGRQIVAADADIRLQTAIILDGQSVEFGKVLLLAVDATP